MKRLGVAINGLNATERCLKLVQTLNSLRDTENVDCCIFHSDYFPFQIAPLFAMYQECEMWDYEGVVIATDFSTAINLINCPGPTKKFFYISEFEWTKVEPLFYNNIRKVYCNEELNLIADNDKIYQVIKNCFKEPVNIIESWSLDKVKDIL